MGSIVKAIIGPSGTGLIGSALGSATKKPDVSTTVSTPTVLPTADSDSVVAAQKKEMLARQQTSGRASTLIQSGTGNPGFNGSSKLGG